MPRNPYVRPVSKTTWWMRQGRYKRYIAREVTCIFIGAYMAVLVWGLMRLSQGQEAWDAFVAGLLSPVGIVFQLLCLGFATYNTVTWFQATPKAMPLMIGEEKVPGKTIIAAHYAAWAGVSLVVLIVVGVF